MHSQSLSVYKGQCQQNAVLCDVGGGGSSGSATLDRLMDTIPFGAKPKIVDLTSDRKLADKVLTCCCITHAHTHACTHACPALVWV